ncbi:hypothetical protein [Pseudomonas sp. D(2018)]|uniref:hypothetical protein n=1 Tax=Pseudomonas sp. D(2018) TaxID=2502238 RepID=UPI0010F5FF7C
MSIKKCLLALAIGGVLSASTVLIPDYISSDSSAIASEKGGDHGGKGDHGGRGDHGGKGGHGGQGGHGGYGGGRG